jgi:hypothetical protein
MAKIAGIENDKRRDIQRREGDIGIKVGHGGSCSCAAVRRRVILS